MADISQLIIDGKYDKAIKEINKQLIKDDKDHWLYAMLSSAFYEKHEYPKALECAELSLKYVPDCPNTLWHYAGALTMIDSEKAISVYKKIMKLGLKKLAYGQCGEGLVNARGLMNDCRVRIGLAYAVLKDNKSATKWLKLYLRLRKPKESIYTKKEVEAAMKSLR